MRLTNNSNKLMSFFIKNNCLKPVSQTRQTDNVFKGIYEQMHDGFQKVRKEKPLSVKTKQIGSVKQIPMPQTFAPNSFPSQVREWINHHTLYLIEFSCHWIGRQIKLVFLTEHSNLDQQTMALYNRYAEYMLVWLYILDQYASRNCASELTTYVYHTSLVKMLPQTAVQVLDENHVNTAFTTTCPSVSEIVIFRKEEWFKVFIHETFHNFGMDFSDMDQTDANERILGLFPVDSEVRLYEAYCEFWARTMNALFCAWTRTHPLTKTRTNHTSVNDALDEFLTNTEFFISLERIYSFFQMVKVLDFMDLEYSFMYSKAKGAQAIRNALYKENTSVLSYYIITLILMNNYQLFLQWCITNNDGKLIQFKKDQQNVQHFCDFIESKYRSKSLLEGIHCTERLLSMVRRTIRTNKKHKDLAYLLVNLRMTICELG